MFRTFKYIIVTAIALLSVTNHFSQEIPNDPNHLPQLIGGGVSNGPVRDPVTVSGKIKISSISITSIVCW